MRIVGGSHRGLRLEEVGRGDAAAHLRPTTDRVREALFNLLAHGGYRTPQVPVEMRVLDLFAGTGALGLEAISRDAREAVLIDSGKAASALQRANIKRMKVEDQVRLMKADATALPPCPGEAFDLVFLDPPYGQKLGQKALKSARENGWLQPEAVIALEDSAPIVQIADFRLLERRNYADSWVHILTPA